MGSKSGGGGSAPSGETSMTRSQANIANTLFSESGPYRKYLESGIGEALGMFPRGSSYSPSAAAKYMADNPDVAQEIGNDPQKAWQQWLDVGRYQVGPANTRVAYSNPEDQTYGLFGASPAEREVIESQFNRAGENIRGTFAAPGSAMNRAMTELNIGRAQNIGGLESTAKQRALGVGQQFAFNTPVQSATILNDAQGNATDVARMQSTWKNEQYRQERQKGQSWGLLFCWIAAELYGLGRKDFYLARYAIFTLWQGRLARIGKRLYLKHGRSIALYLRAHPSLKLLVKPLFDFAVAKARGQLCRTVF